MTEVGIECDVVAFQCQFKKVHTRDCKENTFFLQNSASYNYGKTSNRPKLDFFCVVLQEI